MYKVVFKFNDSFETQDSFVEDIYYSFAAERIEDGVKVINNVGWSFGCEPDKPSISPKTIDKSTLYEWAPLFKCGIYERTLIWTKGDDVIKCIVTDEKVAKWMTLFQDQTLLQHLDLDEDQRAIMALWNGCCNENDCVLLHDWILRRR